METRLRAFSSSSSSHHSSSSGSDNISHDNGEEDAIEPTVSFATLPSFSISHDSDEDQDDSIDRNTFQDNDDRNIKIERSRDDSLDCSFHRLERSELLLSSSTFGCNSSSSGDDDDSQGDEKEIPFDVLPSFSFNTDQKDTIDGNSYQNDEDRDMTFGRRRNDVAESNNDSNGKSFSSLPTYIDSTEGDSPASKSDLVSYSVSDSVSASDLDSDSDSDRGRNDDLRLC